MLVTLPKETEQFIESEVAAGHVGSSDDVIIEALELYQVRQQYIEDQIQQGIADMEAGRSRPYSPQVLADVKQRALKMMALKK
jgi:putative addiction module CopG family antidote